MAVYFSCHKGRFPCCRQSYGVEMILNKISRVKGLVCSPAPKLFPLPF